MKTIFKFRNFKITTKMKFVDKSGEKENLTEEKQLIWVKTFYIINKKKLLFIISKSNEQWYEKGLEKTKRFRLKDKTLFLNKLAIKKI